MNWKKLSADEELSPELAYSLRRDAMRKADRSPEFWVGQQARIETRLTAAPPRPSRPLRFALAGAAMLLCVALVADRGPKSVPQPIPRAQVDTDHELLLTIERSLAAGTPRALEPVALVSESDSKNLSDSMKEQQNEN